jgi:hypothetical protein
MKSVTVQIIRVRLETAAARASQNHICPGEVIFGGKVESGESQRIRNGIKTSTFPGSNMIALTRFQFIHRS